MSENIALLFGADGQLGWELQRSLAPLWSVLPLTRADVDISDLQALRSRIRATKPRVIVNAAAYTSVDKAEQEVSAARSANALAPGLMAEEAKALGAWLVHFSTDYVFDGSKLDAYLETDAVNPLCVYGQTKAEGEQLLAASGASYLTFRTSWVFGPRGGNFLRTILRLAQERDKLSVIDDQIGAPTSAELLADVTAHALRAALHDRLEGGLYHLTAAGETSWHGYASFVVDEAHRLGAKLKLASDGVTPISTEQYPLPASRPKNSRLDCRLLSKALDLELPDWKWHVRRTLKEVINP